MHNISIYNPDFIREGALLLLFYSVPLNYFIRTLASGVLYFEMQPHLLQSMIDIALRWQNGDTGYFALFEMLKWSYNL